MCVSLEVKRSDLVTGGRVDSSGRDCEVLLDPCLSQLIPVHVLTPFA